MKIGKMFIVGSGLIINGKFREKISIGNYVRIGKRARLGNTFNYKRGIVIGDGCFIGNDFTAIDGEIIIGSGCLIADDVSIIAGNHQTNPVLEHGYMNSEMFTESVKIGKHCWIGEKVIVLPGVEIGDFSIVGAGAVVTKSIPDYSIAVGNPAKVIKVFDFSKNQWKNV